MGNLIVKTIRMSSGERFPLLLDKGNGQPLFEPTVYALTQVRARNLASDTIELALRALQVFHLILHIQRIDLEARFQDGRVLEGGEIDELARLSRLHMRQLRRIVNEISLRRSLPNLHSLESFRLRTEKALDEVSPPVSDGRIRWICDYLAWLVSNRLSKLSLNGESYRLLATASKRTTSALAAHLSGSSDRNLLYQREGLAPEIISDLLQVTSPSAPENPWEGPYVRQRNHLIVRWFYVLGLRRGELLNVKVSDIDFRKREVVIARRADDPDDPRLYQPKTKTRDRILPLSKELCQATYDYVITVRRQHFGARRHDYLFVADKTGAPLSMAAVNKCFHVLRNKCCSLPENLSPHVLRHSWNDAFSEAMDRAAIDPAEENKMRSYLMGWSETSGTAATYTRRHIRNKANETSLRMQAIMAKGIVDE